MGCGKNFHRWIFGHLDRFYKASYIGNPLFCEWAASLVHGPGIDFLYRKAYLSLIHKKIAVPCVSIAVEGHNVCNLECVMCPYPDIRRTPQTMSMALFRKVIDEARRNGLRVLNLTLYNEPLLDGLLFERIAYAKARAFKVGFTSNATCLTHEKISKILDSGLDWIIFSVDSGVKECYERIRKGAHFESVCANIHEFLRQRKVKGALKPFVDVHATISSKENLGAVKELTRLFPDADCITSALADSRRTTDYLFAGKFFKGGRRRLYPCPILWGAPTILSSGKAVLCCKDYNGSVEIGDMNTQTLEEILKSAKLERIRRAHLEGQGRTIDICNKCDSLYRAGFSWWSVPAVDPDAIGLTEEYA